jgi:uncharacterized membrane protein YdjX (TVP38/TMEM64 family)
MNTKFVTFLRWFLTIPVVIATLALASSVRIGIPSPLIALLYIISSIMVFVLWAKHLKHRNQ